MENKIITVVENKELIEAIKENIIQWNNIKEEDDSEIVINEIFDNVYDVEVENYNYIVSNDYDALTDLAIERNVEIIEDCGINDTLLFEAEIKGWIDEEYFKEYWNDLHHMMAYDEGIYNIMDADEVELYESGELLEDDIRDNYYNSLQDSIQNNWIDEFKFQFGDDLFNDIVIKENLIDIDKLAQWCVDMDGVAHTLATYDGDEIECNGYYIYRTN